MTVPYEVFKAHALANPEVKREYEALAREMRHEMATKVAATRCGTKRDIGMIYTVIGYTSGIMNTAELRIAISKQGFTQSLPEMMVLTVRAEDFELLSSRFGENFANFVLLNDVAIQVCNALGFPVAPLGTIDESEIRDPLRLL